MKAIIIKNTELLRPIARREEALEGGSKEDGDGALAQAHTASLKRPHSSTDDEHTRHKQIRPDTSTPPTTDPVPPALEQSWFYPFRVDPFLGLEDLSANTIRAQLAQHAATHSAFLPASHLITPPLGKEKDEVPESSVEEGKDEEGKEEEEWRLGAREEGCEVRKDWKGVEAGAEGGEEGGGEGGKEGDGEGDEEDVTEWAVHGGDVKEWEPYGDSGEEREVGDIGCSKGREEGCEERNDRKGVEEGEEGGHVRDEEEGEEGKGDEDEEDGGKVHRKTNERYVEKGFLKKTYLYAKPKALRTAWQGGVSWADRKEARLGTKGKKEAYGKQSQGGKSNLSFPSLTPPLLPESSPSPGSQSPLPEPLSPLPGLSLNPSKEIRPEYGISININGGMIQVDTTTETTPIGRGKSRIIQKGKGKGEGKGRGKGKGRGGEIEKVSWKGKGLLTGHNLVGIVAEEREIFWGMVFWKEREGWG